MNQSARSHTRRVLAVAGSLLVGALLLSPLAANAEWPERPVTLIVPWGAGGGTDQWRGRWRHPWSNRSASR
ncbi:MAG: hypothetical protein M5U09_03985 [Gammaproteobacteria bacterium]|nr:hypothetical protein [Gammaproteobacteria bacterium]